MLERGEISFLFLWILNPVVILFYQNCSWAPPTKVEANPVAGITSPAPEISGSMRLACNESFCAE